MIVALVGGAIVLFQSHAMWDMTSPNAMSWNATLNTSATMGVNIIPLLIVIIIVAIAIGMVATTRGF